MKLNLAATLGTISGYMGAGIYEELLFRLLLLPLAAWILRRVGLGTTAQHGGRRAVDQLAVFHRP